MLPGGDDGGVWAELHEGIGSRSGHRETCIAHPFFSRDAGYGIRGTSHPAVRRIVPDPEERTDGTA